MALAYAQAAIVSVGWRSSAGRPACTIFSLDMKRILLSHRRGQRKKKAFYRQTGLPLTPKEAQPIRQELLVEVLSPQFRHERSTACP